MWRFIILALAVVGPIVAEDCVPQLDKCFDKDYYTEEIKLDEIKSQKQLEEACEHYQNFYRCLDQISSNCADADEYNTKKKDYTSKMDKLSASICTKDGNLAPCILIAIECGKEYVTAEALLASSDIEHACAEVSSFDNCVKQADKNCPAGSSLLSDMKQSEVAINIEESRAGCDPDCVEAMSACVYDLQVSSDKDYCTAYKNGTNCLNRMLSVKGCQGESSQEYLNRAVSHRDSTYKGECNAGNSSISQASLFMTLVFLASALYINMWQ